MKRITDVNHHKHIRKRVHKNLEKYPHPNRLKNYLDKAIVCIGVLTPFFTLPQVCKIWLNKSASDVSMLTWFPYLIFSIMWLWYGIIHKEKPIIILNSGLVIVNLLIVIGIILFG